MMNTVNKYSISNFLWSSIWFTDSVFLWGFLKFSIFRNEELSLLQDAFLALLFALFLFHINRAVIKILSEKYNGISINFDERCFVLFNKNKDVTICQFDNIKNVLIEKGGIVRGIELARVSVMTKTDYVYKVTIEKENDFYAMIEDKVDTRIKKKTFFNPA